MKLYEIKIFIQTDVPSKVLDYVCELVKKEEQLTIKQSWENGYHVSLFGLIDFKRAEEIKNDLIQIQTHSPVAKYDVEEFRKKYLDVAKLTDQLAGLDEIYQNTTKLEEHGDVYIFENEEQLQLYLRINRLFDRFFLHRYFKPNDVLEIIIKLYPFLEFLPETRNHTQTSNGYSSHLSHYVGFLNSLKLESRERAREQFDARVEQDLEIFHARKDNVDTVFLDELIQVYHEVTELVEQNKINFFSPHQYEKHIAPNLHLYHERHAALFGNREYRELIMHDCTLCANKWILNVLYEKFVLMNIKALDKFYMNYFFSCLKYDQEALEV